MKINRMLNILIAVLIIVLVFISCFEYSKRIGREKLAEIAEQEASRNRIPTDENSINLVTDIDFGTNESDGEVFLSYEGFLNGCSRTSYYVGETSVTYRFARTLTSGGSNVYLLNFKMRAENESAQVNVNFGIDHTYYITTEWRDYYVPCIKGQIDSIQIELATPFQKIYLTDLEVLRYDSLTADFHYIKNGSYSAYGIPSYVLSEDDGIGVGATMDITGDGEYLYSAGSEMLKISRIDPDGTSIVSTLEGIGNIRHIELRDKKHLAVASRETGVYIINIEDKQNPYIESYYDSLEIANDVCFSGDYMFVGGRYFGVEVVDISDISNPVYITRIVNDKECFRCVVSRNYLFVSCWATGEVEIYDISTIDTPSLVNTISVAGRCGEMFIDGNTAYIVSGYSDFVNADDVGNAGYGTGNALAIYDISDIKRPVWQSTIKTEGMLYGNGYDDWSVQVSNGYAYFTNSFGGMYIYDVKNLKAPLAVAQIAVVIPPSSSNYVDFSKNAKTVYSYDISEHIYSPAMGIYVDNERIFFACAYNDVYEFYFDSAAVIDKKSDAYEFLRAEVKSEKASDEYSFFLEDYDAYAIKKYNDHYVLATSEGLLLLDENLSLVNICLTENPVKDVKVTSDGYIVTAEKSGVGVYILDGNQFIRTGFVESQTSNRNVSSIGVTGDGNYVIVQSSWTKFEAVDIRDVNNPVLVKEVVAKNGNTININAVTNAGNMYYRNIVSDTVDGAVGIGGSSYMIWFESKNGSLNVKNTYVNLFATEANGNAAMQNNAEILSVYMNGYVVYNPLEATENSLGKLEHYSIPNVRIKGKASIKDNVLVTCNEPSGTVQIVNIGDIANPYLMASYLLSDSPGIAYIEEDCVLVPIRHRGIMKIVLK